MNDKNKRGMIGFILIILLVVFVKTFFGRNVPYPDDKLPEVESGKGKEIILLSSHTASSDRISLDGLEKSMNLIPGAYAKRTIFLLKYEAYGEEGDVDREKMETNLFLDGNLIQSDSFSVKYKNDIYEVFVVDNEYLKDDITKFKLKNSSIFGDNEASISSIKEVWDSEYIYDSPLHLIREGKYMSLPVKENSSILLLPLDDEERMDKSSIHSVDAAGEKIEGVSYNVLSLDNSDWDGSIKPFYIKASTSLDIDFSNLHIVVEGQAISY